jgi:hypothetical protein
MEEWLLMKDMTDTQKILFQSELLRVKKDRNVAFLLTFFLVNLMLIIFICLKWD